MTATGFSAKFTITSVTPNGADFDVYGQVADGSGVYTTLDVLEGDIVYVDISNSPVDNAWVSRYTVIAVLSLEPSQVYITLRHDVPGALSIPNLSDYTYQPAIIGRPSSVLKTSWLASDDLQGIPRYLVSYALDLEKFNNLDNPGGSGATGSGATGLPGATGPSGIGYTGLPGYTGLEGPQGQTGLGVTGPQGLKGDTGLQGAQGDTGSPGSTGPRGPEGPAGLTGSPGVAGPTGYQGLTGFGGIAGPTGAPGLTGITYGATGLPGIPGPTGVPGTPGVTGPTGSAADAMHFKGYIAVDGDFPDILTRMVGDLYKVTGATVNDSVTSQTFVLGDTIFWSTLLLEWELAGNSTTPSQGQTGVQGATGTFGVNGATGVQGLTGITGTQGVTGPRGAPGSKWTTGVYYDVGAAAYYNGLALSATSGHTASAAFSSDLDKWESLDNDCWIGYQAAHGFAGLRAAYLDSAGNYQKAIANAPETLATHFILHASTDYLLAVQSGDYLYVSHGLTGVEYCSTSVAGSLTPVQPDPTAYYINPVAIALNADRFRVVAEQPAYYI